MFFGRSDQCLRWRRPLCTRFLCLHEGLVEVGNEGTGKFREVFRLDAVAHRSRMLFSQGFPLPERNACQAQAEGTDFLGGRISGRSLPRDRYANHADHGFCIPKDKLIRNYDFTFGFCIPFATNSWEAIYPMPTNTTSQVDEFVSPA